MRTNTVTRCLLVNIGLVAFLIMIIVGCGDGRPSRVPVSGQVLIDGKPLSYGFIQFVPHGARASQGKLDSEGRFTLTCFEKDDGAVVGQHGVVILAGEAISDTATRWHAPKKYLDYRQSGLQQEITGPINDLIINISWEGGHPYVEEG